MATVSNLLWCTCVVLVDKDPKQTEVGPTFVEVSCEYRTPLWCMSKLNMTLFQQLFH